MAGIAAVGNAVDGTEGGEVFDKLFILNGNNTLHITGIAPLTPGIKAEFLHYFAQVVGYHINTAQVIVKQVVGGLGLQLVVFVEQGLDGTA